MHKHAHILPSKCLEMFSFKKFRAAIDVLTCLEAPPLQPMEPLQFVTAKESRSKGRVPDPKPRTVWRGKEAFNQIHLMTGCSISSHSWHEFQSFRFFVLRNMYKHRNLFLCCCLLWGVWAWERGLTTIFSFFALQKSTLGLSRFVGWKGATVQQCRSRMCRLEPPLPAASHF